MSHVHGPGCAHHHGDGAPSHAPTRVEMPDAAANPILVHVTRGTMVESVHRARAVAVTADGKVLAGFGGHDQLVYPRSSNKALQALPIIETGAADAFAVTDEELALACASHNAEPMHTGRVAAWLARIGLSADDLECGSHAPYHAATWEAMLRAGQAPSALHNNCSGKHTGMLTTARHEGEPTRGYVGYQHPVQQRVMGVLEQMTGQDLSMAPWGVDGCSIPTIGLPLQALAYGMARLADPVDLPVIRAEAAARIVRAWGRHPELVSGTDTFDTRFMQAVGSRILTKAGAEGVCCAVVPEFGIGLAVKIDDGAGRAAGPAMAALLRKLDLLSEAEMTAMADLVTPAITNRIGTSVGKLLPAF